MEHNRNNAVRERYFICFSVWITKRVYYIKVEGRRVAILEAGVGRDGYRTIEQ